MKSVKMDKARTFFGNKYITGYHIAEASLFAPKLRFTLPSDTDRANPKITTLYKFPLLIQTCEN